ncbi:hypothetical protein J6590_067877 [Homalodisca vitripennis]|nr:hypothetical protein J6590_067877 [Homalodisca vitripennis]
MGERSSPCKQPAFPAIFDGSETTFKQLVHRREIVLKPTNYNKIMERALGRRNRAEILGCVPSLQPLEMGKNSLRPYGRHYKKRRDLARAGAQLCTSVLPRGNFRRFAPQPTLRIDYHSNGTVKQQWNYETRRGNILVVAPANFR